MRSRLRSLLAVLVASGAAIGCAADDPVSQDEGAERLSLQGARGDSPFLSISALGTGCPAGRADVRVASDGLSAKVRFAGFEAAIDPSDTVSVKDCQLAIALRDTDDFRYEVSSTLVGTATLRAGQNARILQFGYLQGDPEGGERATREIDGPHDGRFELAAASASVSTACGVARNVNLRTVVRLKHTGGRSAGRVGFSDGEQTITVSPRRCR